MATDNKLLYNGNNNGDRDWGVDPPGSRSGFNRLGKLLMEVRVELPEFRERSKDHPVWRNI